MNRDTRRQFKEFYANNLAKEAEMFQAPLPSIEEEFQRIAMKNCKAISLERSNSKKFVPETQYVEKLQTFVNASNNKDLKDLRVLNELAGYNEDAHKELMSLQEGRYVANALTHKSSQGNLENARYGFDTYQKVQKLVDKAILKTVTELGKDLTLLPEKQKANSVIDRLSGIKDPKTFERKAVASSAETLRLPELKNKPRNNIKSVTLHSAGHSIVLPSNATLGPSSLLSTDTKEKVLAGFFRKDKKQKHKVDKEKEQIRRDCIENFIKGNEKIKGFSHQYLSTLSHHNGTSLDNLSYKELDSPLIQQSQQVSPNIGPVSNKSLVKSFQGFHSHRTPENVGSLLLSPPKAEQKTSRSRLSFYDNEKSFVGQQKAKESPNKRTLKRPTLSKIEPKGSSRINFEEEEWMKEGGLGKALAKREEYIFEGMGILTLHTEYKTSTKNIRDFEIDHFDMPVKTLKRGDVDYIQKKTGVNLRHSLYDRVVTDRDVMRFEPADLKMLF